MPYPRIQKNTGGTIQNGKAAVEKEITLLSITLGADDKLKVKSAFEKVKASSVMDTLADMAADFINECWSKNDNEAIVIREFIGVLEAAMIAVCGPEVRKELLENIASNVNYFEQTLERTR